ncbi:MAG TPA: hypothetical protein ENJ18_15205 [Nannocystis exedens]|nr:hypothetical protein [Nannocystis exedens]
MARELPDAELVFAFVSPLGTPSREVQEALADALHDHGYEIGVEVRISRLLDELDEMGKLGTDEHRDERQERLMTAGNDLRRRNGGDYLGLSVGRHHQCESLHRCRRVGSTA